MFLNLMMLISLSFGEEIRVAVIDSGLPRFDSKSFNLCDGASKDFTKKGLLDEQGHGTNIAHLIKDNMGAEAKVCFMFLKVYHKPFDPGNLSGYGRAIHHAIRHNAHIINISMSGVGSSSYENAMVQLAIKKNKLVFIAAGNDGKKLSFVTCDVFPACSDKNAIVVGNGKSESQRHKSSNYGEVVDVWIDGYKKGPKGYEMTGSSQSTAILTGKVIKEIYRLLSKSR